MRPNHQRRRNVNSSNTGALTSYCNDVTIRGHAKQIAGKWKELAEMAEKAGDRVVAQLYFQQAEHYNKPVDCI